MEADLSCAEDQRLSDVRAPSALSDDTVILFIAVGVVAKLSKAESGERRDGSRQTPLRKGLSRNTEA